MGRLFENCSKCSFCFHGIIYSAIVAKLVLRQALKIQRAGQGVLVLPSWQVLRAPALAGGGSELSIPILGRLESSPLWRALLESHPLLPPSLSLLCVN